MGKEFKQILGYFLIWRVTLFIIAIFSPYFISKFGGQFPYFNSNLIPSGLPIWVWSFANFDGVHYIRIASGYVSQYSQVFFPLYPLLVSGLSFSGQYILTALALSNIFFCLSLVVLYFLFKLDFNQKISRNSIILLLAFPTAFFFGAVYTEGLFLFLAVSSFFLLRKKQFLLAAFAISLASATKILGILLFAALLLEIYQSFKNKEINTNNISHVILSILIAPTGLLLYMIYLSIGFNDPLYFLTAQEMVGVSRTNEPYILLPQVLFRYLKILTSVSFISQQFWNALLELSFTLTTAALLIATFKKIRKSYWLFSLGVFIIPTLTGTLLSMPRFVLMNFLLLPFLVQILKQNYYLVLILFILVQIILASFFLRGYWIA